MFSDGRRQRRHRCLRCQRLHLKCDGCEPCSACLAKEMDCSKDHSSHVPIRFVSHSISNPIPMPLVDNSWRYTSILLEAIGPSTSSLTSALLFPVICSLYQGDEFVSKTVAVVGGLYACSNKQIMDVPTSEKRDILAAMALQKKAVMRAMVALESDSDRGQHQDHSRSTIILACAMLISFGELLITTTGLSWKKWIKRIARFLTLHHQQYQYHVMTEQLLKLFRFADALRAIIFDESPSCSQPDEDYTEWISHDIARASCGSVMDIFLELLENCATVQKQALVWASKVQKLQDESTEPERDFCLSNTRGDMTLEIEGLEIVSAASRLQRRIIEVVGEGYLQSLDPTIITLAYYCRWALTTISKLFQEPIWQSNGCQLPAMQQSTLLTETVSVMSFFEHLLACAQIEAGLYIPVLNLLGYGNMSIEMRERVLKMLVSVRARGYVVVQAVENDLYSVWAKEDKRVQLIIG